MKIKFMYDTDYDSKETLNSLEMDLNIENMGYLEIRGFFDTFMTAIGIDNPEQAPYYPFEEPNAFVSARYPEDD